MKLTAFRLFAALVAGAQSTIPRGPTTDAEKIADALRTGPDFITDGATILDWPANKGGEFRVLRAGRSEWTCLPGILQNLKIQVYVYANNHYAG